MRNNSSKPIILPRKSKLRNIYKLNNSKYCYTITINLDNYNLALKASRRIKRLSRVRSSLR